MIYGASQDAEISMGKPGGKLESSVWAPKASSRGRKLVTVPEQRGRRPPGVAQKYPHPPRTSSNIANNDTWLEKSAQSSEVILFNHLNNPWVETCPPRAQSYPAVRLKAKLRPRSLGPPPPSAAGGAVICPAAPSFLPPRSHILLIFQMSCLRTEAKDNCNEALIRA